jgi:hypothetical protein
VCHNCIVKNANLKKAITNIKKFTKDTKKCDTINLFLKFFQNLKNTSVRRPVLWENFQYLLLYGNNMLRAGKLIESGLPQIISDSWERCNQKNVNPFVSASMTF